MHIPPHPHSQLHDCGVRWVQVDHLKGIHTASSRLRHGLFGRGSCTGVSSRGRDLTEKSPKSRAPSRAPEKSKKEIEGETKSFIIS